MLSWIVYRLLEESTNPDTNTLQYTIQNYIETNIHKFQSIHSN